jgi:hypothetical protein
MQYTDIWQPCHGVTQQLAAVMTDSTHCTPCPGGAPDVFIVLNRTIGAEPTQNVRLNGAKELGERDNGVALTMVSPAAWY